jgi:FAD/FMN-containing dehydrogenase
MLREKGVFARSFMDFASELRGVVIQPGDLGHDEARSIWHDAPDRHPAVIVRAADAADVQCALAFARAEGLPIVVRSDGHRPAGQTSGSGSQ